MLILSKKGEVLYKSVRIKVFRPGNKGFDAHTFKPAKGLYYHADGIQELLESQARKIEDLRPGHEYRLVPLGPNEFNFVWVSARRQPECSSDQTSPLSLLD